MITAAVDIGTNSVRLLAVDGGEELRREVTITRLGAGLTTTGALDPSAIERTLACLQGYRTLLGDEGAVDVRVVATAAVREADNRDRFVDQASDAIGAPVKVLTGEDEARLGFRGATTGLDPSGGPYCVIDIGGGSTELSLGTTEPEGVDSIPLGSVVVSETMLLHDPPQPEELTNAIGEVEDHLDDVVRQLPGIADARLVGVAGTIISVAAVEIGRYDRRATHHFVLTREAAEDVFRTLATEPLAERVHNPGLQAARADIIVGGCCILVAVLRRLRRHELLVSETDLLDALVLHGARDSDPWS